MPIHIAVREANLNDANSLVDIDIKCFEHAWSPEDWGRVLRTNDLSVHIATYFGTPLAFAVFDLQTNEVVIHKLGVKPKHRLRGLSMELMAVVQDFARRRSVDNISVTIPESLVYPGDHSVGGWLSKLGFRAMKPFLPGHFTSYGEPEAGVKFTLNIGRLLT